MPPQLQHFPGLFPFRKKNGDSDRIDTYTVDNLTYIEAEKRYLLEVDNIKALQYGLKVEAYIYYKGTLISRTFEYSVNSYVQKNKDNTDTALRDFLRAIYLYGKSAYAYGVND